MGAGGLGLGPAKGHFSVIPSHLLSSGFGGILLEGEGAGLSPSSTFWDSAVDTGTLACPVPCPLGLVSVLVGASVTASGDWGSCCGRWGGLCV